MTTNTVFYGGGAPAADDHIGMIQQALSGRFQMYVASVLDSAADRPDCLFLWRNLILVTDVCGVWPIGRRYYGHYGIESMDAWLQQMISQLVVKVMPERFSRQNEC